MPEREPPSEIILELNGIGKSFGDTAVLQDIHFALRRGTVHAVCGENGAGKSTLMKILSGVHQPDGGAMFLDGRPFAPADPAAALEAGISMIYQELDQAEDLTVSENIFLGREPSLPRCPFVLDRARMRAETQALIERYGFDLDPDARIGDLSVGAAQLVELLKALHRQARIVVMDEPTSALSEKEAETLFGIIADLRAKGLAVIYISHRMEEIARLADEVSVLRDGVMVKSAPLAELSIPEIIHLMVGRELRDFYPRRRAASGSTVFEARHLSGGRLRDISLCVHAGEIVGMAGLVGAGRTETADLIFGVTPATSGCCLLHGQELAIRHPHDAIRSRIAYLTEDRKRTGLCLELPAAWNITLPNFDHIGMKALLDLRREIALAAEFGKQVRTRWSSPVDPADRLSGGNQQKLLIARWLMAESDFLIFDEPTRGVDIGAKKEVYEILNMLAAAGKAILLISSELPEILGVCDRVLVMREGQIAADLAVAQASPELVMAYATGTVPAQAKAQATA